MSYLRVLTFFSLVSQVVFAQPEPDSLRAHYIQEYPERFSVWPVLKQRKLSFSVRDKENGHRVRYHPNSTFTMGLGAYLFETVIEATTAIPLNEKRNEIYGESSVKELQVNILAKKFTADGFYQKYSGFYINDKKLNIPFGMAFPQRPDISTRNFGIGGSYVVNHRKFSLRSAFNYIDRQLSSRGSVIVGGNFNSFKLQADSAILKGSSITNINEGTAFDGLRNTTLSFFTGYSYIWIKRKFFVNGTAAFGPAQHWIKYSENGNTRKDNAFNIIATWRLGIGYNTDHFFGGLGYVAQTRGISFGDIKFATTSSLIRIVFGYRFKEIGILKKRAADYIRAGL